MVQVLHISNGNTLNEKLKAAKNALGAALAAGKNDAMILDDVYLAALSRPATQAERDRAAGNQHHLARALAKLGDLLRHAPHQRAVTRQAARANFHDDSAGLFELDTRHGPAWIARELQKRRFEASARRAGHTAEQRLLEPQPSLLTLESAKRYAAFPSLCGTPEAKGTRGSAA